MTLGPAAAITATIPVIFTTGVALKVTKVALRRNGKPVGQLHYHYRGKKVVSHRQVVSHRHEGGNLSHYHKGLKGYGRTKDTLRK